MATMAKRAARKEAQADAPTRPGRPGERGFLFLGMLTIIMVGSILSGMLAEEWAVVDKREREAELLFIQEQYAAAISRFQEDQGRLPTELAEIVEQKGQKDQLFIRQAYTDPMTRAESVDEWCLLQVGGTGQVVSSCAQQDDPFQMGLGSSFSIGQEAQPLNQRQQQVQGLSPGQKGIVGVHSKSSESSFNTLKRGEASYNLWHYTFDQYQQEMSARAIPGLPNQAGPGIGNQPGNSGIGGNGNRGGFGNQGPRGNSPFDNNRGNRNNRNNR